jgi:hypothetical protein
MKKPWLLVLLALAVAGVAVFFVWFLLLIHVMRSIPSVLGTTMLVSLAVIAIGLCAALVFAWRPQGGWAYRTALAVMLVAGLAPAALHWWLSSIGAANQKIEEANKKAEQQAFEAKLLTQIETYRKDVAERIAANNPFTSREAQEFLGFVQGSNLRYRSLPDYSPQTFALLKQALDGKVLNPNARVKGPRAADVSEEPLFVVYYKFYLQSGATMPQKRVREREWKLFQMLIAGGANLDDPAAAVLKDEVKRETAPYDANVPGYITLK